MDLEKEAEIYFSSINRIANRMYVDMNETKSAYEDLWGTLSAEEKSQILDESIIKPEILIKYQQPKNVETKKYAEKLVVDDHCSYRDEHSAPFSFKTPSQRDLTIFTKDAPPPEVPKRKPKGQNICKRLSEDITTIEESSKEASSNILPKTGLDFLDNW